MSFSGHVKVPLAGASILTVRLLDVRASISERLARNVRTSMLGTLTNRALLQ